MIDPEVSFIEADLTLPEHQAWVLELLNDYASDSFGDAQPLAENVKRDLIPGLQKHPTTLIILAFYKDEPAGIAACFLGFSTFAARPLLNIHDFFVRPAFRGQGLGRRLMAAVEAKARALNCCKLTLEVLENNHRAKHLYTTTGFAPATYAPGAGTVLFFAKVL